MRNRLPEIVKNWLAEHPDVSATRLAGMAGINPSTLTRMLNEEPRRIDLNTVEALMSVIDFKESEVIVRVEDSE